MIRYAHMRRYDILTWRYQRFHWYQVCLLNCTSNSWCIIETPSDLPRKSSAIFGNLQKFSVNVRERSSGLQNNFGKSSEKCRHQYVYIYIKRTLHVSSKIWTLCPCGKNNIPLVRCAHSWDIVLATQRWNSYLLATVEYPLFI